MTIRIRIIIFILLPAIQSAFCKEALETIINRTLLRVIPIFIYIEFVLLDLGRLLVAMFPYGK